MVDNGTAMYMKVSHSNTVLLNTVMYSNFMPNIVQAVLTWGISLLCVDFTNLTMGDVTSKVCTCRAEH